MLGGAEADGEHSRKGRHLLFLKMCRHLAVFCLCAHPLSFSLRLPTQEVLPSSLKSSDRKSKFPRTSSTARVSSDEELLSRERSFWKTATSGRFSHSLVCPAVQMCRYLQDGCQVQYLVVQCFQLLIRAALALQALLQLSYQDSQPQSLSPALGPAHSQPAWGP